MRVLLMLATLLTAALPGAAELEVATLFDDGMVLQRGATVPVWGSAPPGSEVTVTIAGRTVATSADADGRWRAELAPLEPGGPHTLEIASGDQRLALGDVLVGDVWICSGQSNMEWVVADSMDADREIAAADDRGLRHFKVPLTWSATPETELAGGEWQPTDPEHVGSFTAVGYYFARELRRHHDVPIGLINTSWGGSRIEPWMRAAALGLDAAGVDRVLAAEAARAEEVYERVSAMIGRNPDHDPGLVEGRAVWADPELDDSGWEPIEPARRWEEQGWDGMDGVVWYRTTFDLSAAEAEHGVHLGLGTIDDSDTSWVNGHRIGRMELAWNKPRVYEVPAAALVEGANVVAVRVEDTGGGGGLYGPDDTRFVEVGGERRPLAGPWRFQVGFATVRLEGRMNQIPTALFNKMVNPLLPFPVAGFLWYQGESNASLAEAGEYRSLFTTMITDWRELWGRGDLPFLWVQLANFRAVEGMEDSGWPLLRESQSTALALPNTAEVVTIDIGDPDDIHPRNKQEVGRRLALAARALLWDEDVVFSGPTYRSHSVADGRLVIQFDHVDGGLVAANSAEGRPGGFEVAGEDMVFVPAEAEIEDGRVVIWSEEAPEPVAARYAWKDDPEGADLRNGAGLPASPFRTVLQP